LILSAFGAAKHQQNGRGKICASLLRPRRLTDEVAGCPIAQLRSQLRFVRQP
jgi:hypothetical protein